MNIKNIKEYYANILMDLVNSGNKAYRDLHAAAGNMGKKSGWGWHPTRNGNKRPGRIRKLLFRMSGSKPNPARRNCKTLNGEIRHGANPRGHYFLSTPTQDQVAALEQRIGLRVRVKGGKCYVGDSEFIVPINTTLDQATKLLDQHLDLVAA